MADSYFEIYMDEYVQKNVVIQSGMHRFDQATKSWVPVAGNQDLDIGINYRLTLRAVNVGTETFVKNVQIRVVRPPALIAFFTDAYYSTQVDRLDSPIYPTTLGPGGMTQPHHVHLRLTGDPDDSAAQPVASLGVYAEIVPQGHYWRNSLWKL